MFKILYCLKCSAELKEGWKVCGKCGEPIPDGLEMNGDAQSKKFKIRDPRSLDRSKTPGKTKVAVVLFVFLPIAALLYFANNFYQTSLEQDDQTRILMLKQHLSKLNENEHRARLEVYRRLMNLDGENKDYMIKFDYHRSQIKKVEARNTKKKKEKFRPSLRGFGTLAQEIDGAKNIFGCKQTKDQYLKVGPEEEKRTRFSCPYEDNHLVVWYVNEAKKNGKTESSQLVWSGQEVNQDTIKGVIQPKDEVEEALKAFVDHYAPENILTLEQAFRETNKGRVVSRHYIFDYEFKLSEEKEFERTITVIPRQ
ncbi:zinc ribbon domain-containing protein [Curvivirga aplysinae]|uniref:zinc ribbon domain-containing protein n=1 Tax=Curvivirga aplysinae TaxID=2529852 RepID=UPI0012BC0B3A|nr:zinc ribbon domain-containing protein [Curvivirga aplysinae]MTI10921.1 zinc ribbon domain-containing protein [Curvivirga aplysinae]